jgi:hypothetical protein
LAFDNGVEVLELDAGLAGGKLPVDGRAVILRAILHHEMAAKLHHAITAKQHRLADCLNWGA